MFLQTIHRSSRPEVFCDKGVLENVTKFTGKHLCQSLFFNKFAGVRSATLLNKRLWHKCFPLNFAKFIRPHLSLQDISNGCFCIQPSRVQEIWFKKKLQRVKPWYKRRNNFGFHETVLTELRLEDKYNYKILFKYDF